MPSILFFVLMGWQRQIMRGIVRGEMGGDTVIVQSDLAKRPTGVCYYLHFVICDFTNEV
jgi:hypothetical protein